MKLFSNYVPLEIILYKKLFEKYRPLKQLEKQEKQHIAEIKKMAKKGEMGTVRIMAKDLVRTRNTQKKFMVMKANIQVIFANFRLL